MSAVIQTAEDVVNLGLRRIGFVGRVGSLYDGSAAAKIALDTYGQTRDALLSDGNWEFAERNVLGAIYKAAPVGGYVPPNTWTSAYPALPWRYSYVYPDDCLKVRAVKTAPAFIQNADPKTQRYSVDNDGGIRVILSNVQNAVIVYTGQVTNPSTFDVEFIEALAAAIGRRLAPALVGVEGAKLAMNDEMYEKQQADRTQE